jgi:hypothetical protein
MALRTSAVLSVQSTTVPQPLLGSWITAGIGAPATRPITLTLGTATSSGNDATNLFHPGDPAWIIDPNGANAEAVLISGVSGNTVTLGPQSSMDALGGANPVTRSTHVSGAFGVGSFILLNFDVNNVYVSFEDGATGAWLYLGNAINMTATYRRFAKLAKVAAGTQPQAYGAAESSPGNPFRTSEFWVLGTNVGDLYNAAFCVA